MAIWNAVSAFTDWMWGNPLLILLVGGGIVLAFIIKGIQFRKFGFIWRNTVGTGNIVGVSSAIAIGGPGALFWMFICGFIAMGHQVRRGDSRRCIS